MKKVLLIFLGLLITFTFLAQKHSFGVQSGVLYGAPIGPANEGDKGFLQVGSSFGLTYEFKFNSIFSINTGVSLSNKRGAYDAVAEGDTTYEFEIPNQPSAFFPTTYKGRVKGAFDNAYIDIPLFFSVKVNKRMRTQIGVYNGFIISKSHKGDVNLVLGNNFRTIEEKFDDSKYIANYDLGLLFGGTYDILPNKLAFGFRGTFGLTSLFTDDYPNVTDKFSNLYMNPFIKITIL